MNRTYLRFALFSLLLLTDLSFCWANSVTIPTRKAGDVASAVANYVAKRSESITGVSEALWVADIGIGTPTQTFSLQIDSGSPILAVYSSQCTNTNCPGGVTSTYSSSSSSSYSVLPCNSVCSGYGGTTCQSSMCVGSATYGDGSGWNGYLAYDKVTIAGYSATAMFAQIYKTSSQFEAPEADGILGLSFSSTSAGTSPLDTILSGNSLPNSYYLGLGYNEKGVMTLGNADSAYYTGSFKNVTLDKGTIFYASTPTTLTVGSTTITSTSSDFGQTIFDSGTTFVMFSSTSFAKVKSVVQSTYGSQFSCFQQSTFWTQSSVCQISDISQWPTFHFTFSGGVTLDLTPEGYLLSAGGNYYWLGITDLGSNSMTILGDPFFAGKYIGFDRTNRIGMFASLSGSSTATSSTKSTSSTATTHATTATSSPTKTSKTKSPSKTTTPTSQAETQQEATTAATDNAVAGGSAVDDDAGATSLEAQTSPAPYSTNPKAAIGSALFIVMVAFLF